MQEQLYKKVNGKLITPPKAGTRHTGESVSGYNRLEPAKLREDGWKPLRNEPMPDDGKEYEPYTVETETEFIQKWREYENE